MLSVYMLLEQAEIKPPSFFYPYALLQSPKAQQDKARMNIDTILYMRLCGKLRLRLYIYARQFLIYAGFSCNFIQIFLYIWLVFAFLYEFFQIACNSNREFI